MERKLARNALYNVAGAAAPMVAAAFSVPLLVHGLGTSRLGVFTLFLGFFGFAGIFDLGLGRALTRSIATFSGQGVTAEQLAGLVRYALSRVALLGLLWGGALYLTAPLWMELLVGQAPELAQEVSGALPWLAALIPVTLLSASLVGVLEGRQRFAALNLIRVPLSIATALAPAVVSLRYPQLSIVVAVFAAVRMAGLAAMLVVAARELPLSGGRRAPPLPIRDMWCFSGWLSVSNVVGPLMVYADRFYLATLFPPAIVARYTVPLDALFRATSFPGAALGALYPAIAGRGHDQVTNYDPALRASAPLLWCAWTLPLVLLAIWLPAVLEVWLRGSFAAETTEIARWVLVGVLVNGYALIPFTVLQGLGRADLTAKLHVLELPVFLLSLVWLVDLFGVKGAAMAWTLRVAIDTIGLFALLSKHRGESTRGLSALAASWVAGGCVVVATALLDGHGLRLVATMVLLVMSVPMAAGCVAWMPLIQGEHDGRRV